LKLNFVFNSLDAPMQLSDASLGQVLTVHNVGGDRAFRRRLMEFGLVPGTRVELVAVAPLGDPIELLVRGSSLSIRRADARQVSVVAVETERSSVRALPAGAIASAAASESIAASGPT
jgi:Fe2+ transport system protein FeoA